MMNPPSLESAQTVGCDGTFDENVPLNMNTSQQPGHVLCDAKSLPEKSKNKLSGKYSNEKNNMNNNGKNNMNNNESDSISNDKASNPVTTFLLMISTLCRSWWKSVEGDRINMIVLLLLYCLQGIPMGISLTIPLVMQERGAGYASQAVFSIVTLPFSLKLLWAPLVDSYYFKKIGRRKSWMLPTQTLCGLCLVFLGPLVDIWIGREVIPASSDGFFDSTLSPDSPVMKHMAINITALSSFFVFLYFLMATQDIAVDAWALTLLQRKNVGYAGTINNIGQYLGIYLAHIGYLILSSPETCNRYFRSSPSPDGIVDIASFMQICGMLFLITTLLVGLFVKEYPIHPYDAERLLARSRRLSRRSTQVGSLVESESPGMEAQVASRVESLSSPVFEEHCEEKDQDGNDNDNDDILIRSPLLSSPSQDQVQARAMAGSELDDDFNSDSNSNSDFDSTIGSGSEKQPATLVLSSLRQETFDADVDADVGLDVDGDGDVNDSVNGKSTLSGTTDIDDTDMTSIRIRSSASRSRTASRPRVLSCLAESESDMMKGSHVTKVNQNDHDHDIDDDDVDDDDDDDLVEPEESHSLKETFHRICQVLKLPAVQLMCLFLLTSKLGTAPSDHVTQLKLFERGLKKTDVAILASLSSPVSILAPILFTGIANGPNAFKFSLYVTPIRVLYGLLWAFFVLLYPSLHSHFSFFVWLFILTIGQSILSVFQSVTLMAFFAKIADPKIGGTFITLLNTASNLGGSSTKMLSMYLIDIFTVKTCVVPPVSMVVDAIDANPDVTAISRGLSTHAMDLIRGASDSPTLSTAIYQVGVLARKSASVVGFDWLVKESLSVDGVPWVETHGLHQCGLSQSDHSAICSSIGGQCVTSVDGYFIELILFSSLGLLWLWYITRKIRHMDSLPTSAWRSDL